MSDRTPVPAQLQEPVRLASPAQVSYLEGLRDGKDLSTLSPEQIDHLSSRIAPAVVERLATSGLPGIAPDARVAAQQREAGERLKSEQAAAYSQAVKIVDQMIASHDITPQGRNQAHELLRQTGQTDRAFELEARISAAINRGDLTPEQAGISP